MRLSSHSLPKVVHKKVRTVKHKDSAAMLQRKEKKKAKTETMDICDNSFSASKSEIDREEARQQRKKVNAHKISYKKIKKIR